MRSNHIDELGPIEPILAVLPPNQHSKEMLFIEPVWQPALASSRGVYRLTVTAEDGGGLEAATYVVKVVDDSPPGRREADLYASGELRRLAPPMTAAWCHGVVPLADGLTAIVLEHLQDCFHGQWPMAAYTQVARLLGIFSAQPPPALASAAHAVPPRDLLARDAAFADAVDAMSALGRNADVIRIFSPVTIERLRWLAVEGRASIRKDGSGPYVVCHGDAQRRNLIAMDDGQVAFLDWANMATGPLGHDVATLAYYAIAWADLQIDDLNDFLCQLIEAYLEGLANAGWTGDIGAVWTSTYGQLVVGLGTLEAINTMRMLIDPVRAQSTAKRIGQPVALLIARRQWLTHKLLDLADRLLPELDRTRR